MARLIAPWTEAAFGDEIERHRRDLMLLCYRFLGSVHDAEEAVQETALRAWRGRAGFRGDASPRTWLHRVATRVCLDQLARRRNRPMPWSISPAVTPDVAPQLTSEIGWLEPIPDDLVADRWTDHAHDPAERAVRREMISLAFLAALQALPARQRAVLLLCDVLEWSAPEAARALDTTASSVSSLLHRARRRMRAARGGVSGEPFAGLPPDDPTVAMQLDAYVRAWEADDVDAIVATLREDVRLAMPPSPAWYRGVGDVRGLLARWILPQGRYALRPVSPGVNLQPTLAFDRRQPDGSTSPLGLQVLTVQRDGIAEVAVFFAERQDDATGFDAETA